MDTQKYKTVTSSISHELGNLLSLATCSLQLIETEHPEVCGYRHWFEVQEELKQMQNLIAGLSSLNQADKIQKKPTDMHDLITRLYHSCLPWFKEKNISFQLDCHGAVAIALVDSEKLYRALLNLVKNSLEALEETKDGIVSIVVSQKEEQLSILISDNGIGMDEAVQRMILSPYVTYKKRGTGLGLPIAMETIQSHGGNLEIHSTPGKGTRITITLPLT